MKQFQSFHIVRLFGIVSKCSPTSAVAAAAARTFRSGVAGGSSSGSGGVVTGGGVGVGGGGGNGGVGGANTSQTKFRFSLRRLLSCSTPWRRRQPSRQAVPVPIYKKPLSISTEDTALSNPGNGGSPTPTAQPAACEASNKLSKNCTALPI